MSNLKRTARDQPLTFTVAEDGGTYSLTTTRGKMGLVKAAEGDLGTDSRGSAVGDKHFDLVKSATTRRPPRYIDVAAPATGSDKANVDTQVIVEFWHAEAEMWIAAEPIRAAGSAVLLAADNYVIGEWRTVKVPRGATAGRFHVPSLAADQGLDLIVDADNDD